MRFLLVALLLTSAVLHAQTPESSPAPSQIDALSKKVDEINTKIDALSQQLLKMEQQMSRPGVMIGEATPASTAMPVATASAAIDASHPGSTTHVVARGETLTSIAKQYKVGVEDLQKFNHIEDGRKLQAGQTVLIPPAGSTASPSATPSPSVGE